MIKSSDVIALKLAYIFINSYSYSFVVVQSDDKNLWLANQRNKDHNLIKISSGAAGDSFFNRQYIDSVKEQVRQIIKKDVSLLEIYTGNTISEFNKEDFGAVWGTNEAMQLPEAIAAIYPALSAAFDKIDEPQKEYDELKKRIGTWVNTKDRRAKFKTNKQLPLVTITVTLLCLVFYALRWYFNEFSDSPTAIAVALGAYYKAFIVGAGQYWRFLTCGFVHVEFMHLAFNLYAFYNIGRFLEPLLGKLKYSTILFCGIITGSLFQFIGDGNRIAYGLSGGVYALLAVLLIVFFKTGIIKNPRMRNQVAIIGLICLIDNFSPDVSWLGHSGGLVSGLLWGLVFLYNNNKALVRNAIIALVTLFTLLSFMAWQSADIDSQFHLLDNEVYRIYRQLGLNGYSNKIEKKVRTYYRARR